MNKILKSVLDISKQERDISSELDQAVESLVEGSVTAIRSIPVNGGGYLSFNVINRDDLDPAIDAVIEGSGNVIQFYDSAGQVVQRVDAIEWDGVIDDSVNTLSSGLTRDITYIMSEVRSSIDYHDTVESIVSAFVTEGKVAKSDILSRCDNALALSSNYDIRVLRSYIQEIPKDTLLPTDILGILKQLYGSSQEVIEEQSSPSIPQSGFLITTATITMVLKTVVNVLSELVLLLGKIIGLIAYGIVKLFKYVASVAEQGNIEWNPDVFNYHYSAPLSSQYLAGELINPDTLQGVEVTMLSGVGFDTGYAMGQRYLGSTLYSTYWGPKINYDPDIPISYSAGLAAYLTHDFDIYKFWNHFDTKLGMVKVRRYLPSSENGPIFINDDNAKNAISIHWDWLLGLFDRTINTSVFKAYDGLLIDADDDRVSQVSAAKNGCFRALKVSLLIWLFTSCGAAKCEPFRLVRSSFGTDEDWFVVLCPARPKLTENSTLLDVCRALAHDFTTAVSSERSDIEVYFNDLFSNDDALNALNVLAREHSEVTSVAGARSYNPLIDYDAFYCITASLNGTAPYPASYSYGISLSPALTHALPGLRYGSGDNMRATVATQALELRNTWEGVKGFPAHFTYDMPTITKSKAWRVLIYTSLITAAVLGGAYFGRRKYIKSRTKKMVDRSLVVESKMTAYKADPTPDNYKAYVKAARKYNKIAKALGYSPVGVLANKTIPSSSGSALPKVDMTDQVSSFLGVSDTTNVDIADNYLIGLISGE